MRDKYLNTSWRCRLNCQLATTASVKAVLEGSRKFCERVAKLGQAEAQDSRLLSNLLQQEKEYSKQRSAPRVRVRRHLITESHLSPMLSCR